MIFAVKMPLEVTQEHEGSLIGQSKILNWSYNHLNQIAISKKDEFIRTKDPEIAKLIYSKKGLRDLLPALKKEKPFLNSVHSVPLKNAAIRLSRSIQRYQEDRKKPKKDRLGIGWPKFRSSKKKFFSLLYDEYGNGFQFEKDPNEGWVLILSLGVTENQKRMTHRIKIKEMPNWLSEVILEAERIYPEMRRLKSAEERKKFHIRKLMPFTELRIKKEGNEWSAVLSVERKDKGAPNEELQPPIENKRVIQKVAVIDPNHKNLGYLVDTEGNAIELANLSFIKMLDQRIDEIKRRRDCCLRKSVRIDRADGSVVYKPSKRWRFFASYLEELYRIRREQIKSGLYTLANKLMDYYDLVAVGNYTPQGGGLSKGMRRAMNNQSQIGKFKQTLEWVCRREGKIYQEWDERNSTKTCHRCGDQTDLTKDPSVRSWHCNTCGLTHIRDENAAQNGSRLIIEWIKQKQLPCSGHLEAKVKNEKYFTVASRWAWCFNGSGISVSRA